VNGVSILFLIHAFFFLSRDCSNHKPPTETTFVHSVLYSGSLVCASHHISMLCICTLDYVDMITFLFSKQRNCYLHSVGT